MTASRAKGLLQLDSKYVNLEERKRKLLRQLEEIEEERTRLDIERAAYAPVYSVPNDVLYQILEEAFAHEQHNCSLDYHCATPIAIGQVSRRWRRLALSLPRIWSCIHVPVPLSSSHVPTLSLYIARSQQVPISFTMRCRFYKASSPQMRLYMDCLALLLKTRVRSCTLYTDYFDTMEALLRSFSTADKSYFQHMRLQVVGEETRLFMDPECLPSSLHFLSLYAVRLPSPPIALQNLRRLVLEYQPISLHYLHEIAMACPELSTFMLREVTTSGASTHLEARFPSLRRLSLLEIHLSGIRDLLSWIEAPRLNTLVIRDISLGTAAAPRIPVPQYKTYPALQHVSIRFPYAASHIPEFLCHTPHVVSLDLTGTNAGPLARALLAPAERGKVLLPWLQSMTATILWNERHDVLFELVKYREQIRHPMKEIRLGHVLLAEMDSELLDLLSKHVAVTRIPEDHPGRAE